MPTIKNVVNKIYRF